MVYAEQNKAKLDCILLFRFLFFPCDLPFGSYPILHSAASHETF